VLFLLVTAAVGGCGVRLSDPVYAFKEIRAEEPSRPGKSLIFGTIMVETWMSGDLDTVTLTKLGTGDEPHYYGVNRVNLFRVFFRRSVKDGNFIMEVDPGVYEVDSFSTSGWGRPQEWRAREDARKHTRIVVTRPGVYDLGTLHVQRGESLLSGYVIERSAESPPARREVLERAVAGTRWQRMLAVDPEK
jgi:hypothetical protein